jgi:hypothetical protein
MEGENPVTVGMPPPVATRNALLLVAVPAGEVTEIGPVAAPDGTVAISCVGVADETAAATPLNVTVF